MHELSVVLSIIEIADEQLKKSTARQIESIELEIGTLAGIEMEALLFAWDAAIPHTVLENTKRIIRQIPAVALCLDCGKKYQVEQIFEACPACKGYSNELVQGNELRVKSLMVS